MSGEFKKTIEPEKLAKQFKSVPETGVTHALMESVFPKAVKYNQQVLAHNEKLIKERENAEKEKAEPIVVNW